MNKTKPPLKSDPSMDLIYVIGDPEGQTDLLAKMFQKIQHNPSQLPFAENDKIVIMGNYIHPSEPSGMDMIDLIRSQKANLKDQVVVLRGRNEHRLLKNRANFHASDLGEKYVSSYRVPSYDVGYMSGEKHLHCTALVEDMNWLLKNTTKFFETNKYFICSSGVSPTVDTLDKQNINSLMYIGETFTKSQKKFEKMVVHGTVLGKNKVDIKSNRINVNTNCSKTRVLSCVVLDDKDGKVKEIITVQAA